MFRKTVNSTELFTSSIYNLSRAQWRHWTDGKCLPSFIIIFPILVVKYLSFLWILRILKQIRSDLIGIRVDLIQLPVFHIGKSIIFVYILMEFLNTNLNTNQTCSVINIENIRFWKTNLNSLLYNKTVLMNI